MFLVLTGLLNALIAAFLFLHLPENHAPSLGSLIRRAVIFVVVGALAGTAGSWFYWRTSDSPFRANPPIPFHHFALVCAACWIWVPAFVLLSREDSPLTGPIAVLAAALLAFSLRKALPPAAKPTPPGEDGLFAATLRTPPWQWSGYLIALAVYAAGYELANRWIIDGSCLLACAAFLFAWNRTLAPRPQPIPQLQARRAARRLAWAIVPAILITLFTLLYGIGHRNRLEADAALAAVRANPGSASDEPSSTPPRPPRPTASRATRASSFGPSSRRSRSFRPFRTPSTCSPPEPPSLSSSASTAPTTTSSRRIKLPASTPTRLSGTPLAVTSRPTTSSPSSWRPIRLSASKSLSPAAAKSRSAYSTTTTAAAPSTWPSSSLTQPPPTTSSTSASSPCSPASPTISPQILPRRRDTAFPHPHPAKIRKFDEITVMFLPDSANYDKGPKVAIEQFQLIPR